MARAEPIPDHELPDELPEQFVGTKIMDVHYNFGRDGGAGLGAWLDKDGRAWPIQEQYDTRKPKPAKGKDAPGGTGVTNGKIRAIFLAHGFTIKEGQTDLKPYVYAAAHALLRAWAEEPVRQMGSGITRVADADSAHGVVPSDDAQPKGGA